MKTFDIVTVNWNSGIQLRDCIHSITTSKYNNCILNKIIIIDNNSNDNSLELVKSLKIQNVVIIKNDNNFGFGKACNIGIETSTSNFILFLNPDTLLYKNTFSTFFEYINKFDNQTIGVYGLKLIGDDTYIQRTCARFPTVLNFLVKSSGLNKINNTFFKSYHLETWKHNETKNVDHVIGAFYLIKSDVLNKVKGFDERFFLYMEDLDLSKRVHDHGYNIRFVSESEAYHKGGGTSENVKAKRLFYSTQSRIIYGLKYFGFFKGIFLLFFTFLIEPITRISYLILKGKYSEITEVFIGFGLLYKNIFSIIKLGLKK